MPPILKQFFKDIDQWVEAGFPEHESFSTDYGICKNLLDYLRDCPVCSSTQIKLITDVLDILMGNSSLPFNIDYFDYKWEQHTNTLYTNPKRLAFIKKYSLW